MPDATVVCRCNDVSKGALVACWRAGARTVAALSAATRAATGCGGCRDAVAGIAAWLTEADPPGGDAGSRDADGRATRGPGGGTDDAGSRSRVVASDGAPGPDGRQTSAGRNREAVEVTR